MSQDFDFQSEIKAAKDRAAKTAILEKLFLQILDTFLQKIPDGLDLHEKYNRICACITDTSIPVHREIIKAKISQENKSLAVSIITKMINYTFDNITKQYLEPFLRPESDKLTEITEFQKDVYLPVLSAKQYKECQEAICKGLFGSMQGTPWPTFPLKDGGNIQLRPPQIEGQLLLPPEEIEALAESMFKQISELSDLDADSLDILTSNWIAQNPKSIDSRAVGDIDQFLAMRGLAPKHKGRGLAFRKKQRREMLKSISRIQCLWFDMGEVEVYCLDGKKNKKKKEVIHSRAFSITDTKGQRRLDGFVDVQKFIYVPGTAFALFIFGPGRQTALLSSMALKYDPYRQKPEKRLARYFSWQWRIKAKTGELVNSYLVDTLLEVIGDAISPTMIKNDPSGAQRRLEKALDTLEGLKVVDGKLIRVQAEQVISGWQYKNWDESLTDKRGWFDAYRKTAIIIEAPDLIKKHYQSIPENTRKRLEKLSRKKPKALPEPAASFNGLGEKLRTERRRRGDTQLMIADFLEVTPSYVSQIENGRVNPSPKVRGKIRDWLEQKP